MKTQVLRPSPFVLLFLRFHACIERLLYTTIASDPDLTFCLPRPALFSRFWSNGPVRSGGGDVFLFPWPCSSSPRRSSVVPGGRRDQGWGLGSGGRPSGLGP